MTKPEKKQLKDLMIAARTHGKMVQALCAIYNVDTDYRESDSFFNTLHRKCREAAEKEEN